MPKYVTERVESWVSATASSVTTVQCRRRKKSARFVRTLIERLTLAREQTLTSVDVGG